MGVYPIQLESRIQGVATCVHVDLEFISKESKGRNTGLELLLRMYDQRYYDTVKNMANKITVSAAQRIWVGDI